MIYVDYPAEKKTNEVNGTKECGWQRQLRMCSAAGRWAVIEGETEQDRGCAENVCARDGCVNTRVCAQRASLEAAKEKVNSMVATLQTCVLNKLNFCVRLRVSAFRGVKAVCPFLPLCSDVHVCLARRWHYYFVDLERRLSSRFARNVSSVFSSEADYSIVGF